MNVFREHVGLDVDVVADFSLAQASDQTGMGDDPNPDTGREGVRDRKTDSIDRDAALLDEVRQEIFGSVDFEKVVRSLRPPRPDASHFVDVTRHEMAAKPSVGPQRALDIDPLSWLERSQVRAVPRFLEQVELKRPSVFPFFDMRGCQARAIDRDALADMDGIRQRWRLDSQLNAACVAEDRGYGSRGFNNSCKHRMLDKGNESEAASVTSLVEFLTNLGPARHRENGSRRLVFASQTA